jgi:hypothetical protein
MLLQQSQSAFRLTSAVLLALASLQTAAGQEKEKPQSALPLKKVVLFNSGVGFFEHAAEIEGDVAVDLKFNVEDINDLLKSMVVEDLGGGQVSTVNYASKDPITKTLKTFAIDLTENPTLADLLSQIRGEKVQLEAPNPVTGTILSLEQREELRRKDEEPVKVDVLNLLTDEGLRSIPLNTVGKIKLLDEKLDAELRQALAILALSHATDKKSVSLHFMGQGKRPVRVGYIQEAPIWKTSYRLVLGDDDAPLLQGWAIVENTTEEDWQDVRLTLVSGRPISFIMDLYQPLYVQRPVVEPELFASLRPQTYGQDLADRELNFQRAGDAVARQRALSRRGWAAPEPAAAPAAPKDAAGTETLGALADKADFSVGARFSLAEGVRSIAQAEDVGELFQYAIENEVTLPRQQSAMLPIVHGSVQAVRHSIYNPSVHAKHPLNGLKLTNSTGLHLMQGPITVFDDGVYAGDARIEDLPAGSERLISYALDLDTEVAVEQKPKPEQLVSVKIVKGVLHSQRKLERTRNYTIKNSGDKSKQMLIESPIDPSWKLIEPKEPAEKTRDVYRFAVEAEPGKSAKLTVTEEQVTQQQVALTNLDSNLIVYYLNNKNVGDNVKESLRDVVRRRQQISELSSELARLQNQAKEIDAEQSRIRQNMERLDRNTELYNRYVKKFGEQEDQIEKIRTQMHQLEQEIASRQQELDKHLAELSLE